MVLEKARQFIEENSAELKKRFEADNINYEEAKESILSGQIETSLSSLLDSTDTSVSDKMDQYYEKLKAEYEKKKGASIEAVTESVIDTVKQKAEQAGDAVVDAAEKKINEKFPIIGQLKSIWSSITSGIDKLTLGISSLFDKIVATVLGAFGISTAVAGETEKPEEEKEGDNKNAEKPETTVETSDVDTKNDAVLYDQPESIESGIDISKKATYETLGYKTIALQSGIKKENNINTLATYATIGDMSIEQIHEKLKNFEASGEVDIVKAFGLTPNTDPALAKDAIVSIIGPFSQSLLRSTFIQTDNIKQLLFSNENGEIYSEVKEVLSTKEMDDMKAIRYDYRKMPFTVVSRLVALYWKEKSVTGYKNLTQSVSGTGNSIQEFMLGGELAQSIRTLGINKEQSNIYPENFANLFRNILGTDYLHKTGKELRESEHGRDINFSESEIKKLDEFVIFRDKVLEKIGGEYDLGMDNFSSIIENKISYSSIITLYLLLGGKDIDSLDNNETLIVHAWIYEILGDEKGKYRAAILDTLVNKDSELSEDQRNILTVMLFRFLESNRNATLSLLKTSIDTVHETIKDRVIPAELNVAQETEDYLVYALEGAGAMGLWKILAFMPHIRAALFVASGLTLGAVYLFGQDVVYESLDSEIQEKYDLFLETHIGGADGSQIRKDIISGNIAASELIEKLKGVSIDELVNAK